MSDEKMISPSLPAGRDGVWAVRGEHWAQVYAPDIPGLDVTLEVDGELAGHFTPERAYALGLALAGLDVTVEIDEEIAWYLEPEQNYRLGLALMAAARRAGHRVTGVGVSTETLALVACERCPRPTLLSPGGLCADCIADIGLHHPDEHAEWLVQVKARTEA